MVINFTPEEYEKLCRVADYYGTKPAWLAYTWISKALLLEDWLIARGGRKEMGLGDGMGPSHDHPALPSHPGDQEPA